MAQAVVHELEVVEVDEHHRDVARVALGIYRPAQAVVQEVAVGQAGEGVVVRLVLELHLVALALDRILHRAQQELAVQASLDQVVLRAAFHGRKRDRGVVVSGEHDDGHGGRMRVDLGEGLQAEAVGQRQIEQHECGVAGIQPLEAAQQPVLAMHFERYVGVLGDHLADESRVPGVVLDKEDFMHQ
jgi:hypothetical protein